MTAFSPSDLPASVNTVEKLAVWASTVLNDLNPNLTVIESTGQSQLAATSYPFRITASDPPAWRVISRTSIVLGDTWRRGNGKIWTYAQDLGTAPIPTEYKS